jgi:hypothetical protein
MIAQRQQQIEKLTAQVKEQVTEIQKVNTQVEMHKPAAKMIVNKPKAVPSERLHSDAQMMKQN